MKFGKILAVAVVATVFASCSNEEELAQAEFPVHGFFEKC